jgi:hypothetical protein
MKASIMIAMLFIVGCSWCEESWNQLRERALAEQYRERLIICGHWNRWFAWRPVPINGGYGGFDANEYAWLKTVERKGDDFCNDISPWEWPAGVSYYYRNPVDAEGNAK